MSHLSKYVELVRRVLVDENEVQKIVGVATGAREPDSIDEIEMSIGFISSFLEEVLREVGVSVWLTHIMDSDGKDNVVKVMHTICLRDEWDTSYYYDVVLHTIICRWGALADGPEKFDAAVERIISEVQRRFEVLSSRLSEGA